jgi:methylglyoxal synthase
MKIALIAHDKKKRELIDFVSKHRLAFSMHELYATGTTGSMVIEETKLSVKLKKSGPLGGDQEIGSMVANKKIDMIFFFRDPLTAQPHEPDVSALLRLSDVYQVPLATNIKTAELFISILES